MGSKRRTSMRALNAIGSSVYLKEMLHLGRRAGRPYFAFMNALPGCWLSSFSAYPGGSRLD